MEKARLLLLFLLVCPSLWAQQQTVASGGNYHQNASGSISFTVGEAAIQTLREGEYIVTQGFQQSKLVISSVNEIPGVKLMLTAYPNPAHDNVNLRVEGEIAGLSFAVFDLNGRLLKQGFFDANPTKIPFADFKTGIYLIRVLKASKELQIFKIVKQ